MTGDRLIIIKKINHCDLCFFSQKLLRFENVIKMKFYKKLRKISKFHFNTSHSGTFYGNRRQKSITKPILHKKIDWVKY